MKGWMRLVLGVLIVFAIAYLLTHLMAEKQFFPYSDEGYYFRYAQAIDQKGLSGFTDLISWYANDPTAHKHPPPSRAGYILFSVLLFKIFGSRYFVLGVFSAACFVFFLILNFCYVRKYFDLDIALLASVFLSSSPLMLGMARRALIDSPLNLLWGTSVWLLFDYLMEGQAIKFVGFLFIFTLSLFFKEGSFILLPFFILSLFIFLPKNKQLFWPLTAVVCLVPLLVLVVASIFILGGWDVFYKMAHSLSYIYKHDAGFNSYVSQYCEGPWYRYLLDFVVLTPVISLLAFGYSFNFWLSGCQDKRLKFFLIYGASLYLLLSVFQNNQDVRYAINLEMVMALFAAFGLQGICRFAGTSWMNYSILMVGIGIFALNFSNFIHIFLVVNVLDPISYRLLAISHIIP